MKFRITGGNDGMRGIRTLEVNTTDELGALLEWRNHIRATRGTQWCLRSGDHITITVIE